MANLAGINRILCKVKGNVKYTSLDSGQTKWKTGNLEVATMATGQVVCVVNFEIGPSKKFPLTNQIKGVIFNHTTPRCVINLKNGTNINWLGKGTDIGPVDFFSRILEELKNEQKRDRRPNTSALTSLHLSPQGKALSPVKQSPRPRNSSYNRPQTNTPRSRLPPATPRTPAAFTPQKNLTPTKGPTGRTSPNPMMTPSHLKAALNNSISNPADVLEIMDKNETDSDETTELSPLLFTEEQEGQNKENMKNYRIPKFSTNSRGKSVLQMRKEEGGSIFMSSFQEKQLQLEERKENTAPRPVSAVPNFYSRGRQAAGYIATDALLQPRQTNVNTSVKRTPGFLSLSQPKRPRLGTSYVGWSQRNIFSTVKTSQISLQGFSNLGNTCYMNAILQSLFALDCFTMDMLNADLLPHMQRSSLYKAVASLLFAKQRNESADKVGTKLRRIKEAISSTATRFSGFMQHDAQEFLCQCLDQLKDDWENAKKQVQGSPLSDNSLTGARRDPKSAHSCPVIRNFEFEVMHSIVCKQCGEVVTKAEQFYDLSLDLPRRSSSDPIGSIQTALEQFFREEAIEYACSECDCKQATVAHNFTRLPRVIIVHLKRYRFDVDAVQNAKLRRRILIPRFLTLHYHCTKETQSPTSAPNSLLNGTSSPRGPISREQVLRPSVTGLTDGTTLVTGQSAKPSRFNFSSSSRKRLEYNGDSARTQPRQTILLDGIPGTDGDETQRALEMSKKEAEKAKQEEEERQRREEEELKRAMEESKQDADRSITEMSEEQQLAYALAISTHDASISQLPRRHGFSQDSGPEGEDHPGVPHEMRNSAGLPNSAETGDDVFLTLKRRGMDDIQGFDNGADVGSKENVTPWKRFKSEDGVSNQSTPSEHVLCAGDSAIDLTDNNDHTKSSRTPSRSWRGVKKSIINLFTPVKQTPNDSGVSLDNNTPNTPHLTQKPSLVEAASVDIHRGLDHNTLHSGETGSEKPSYEELKAKEDEELRRATELSLQDAQERAKEEEEDLKRAKEISLQEFSENLSSLDEEDAEPMEIDGDSDDDVAKELAKNAKTGHLPSSYRLVSVVSHMGSTSAVGHYISDVYDSKKKAWLSYDDSQVVRTNESAVCEDRERTGYIFFYVAK